MVCRTCLLFQSRGHCAACVQTGRTRGARIRTGALLALAGVVGVAVWGLVRAPAHDKAFAQIKAEKEREAKYEAFEAILAKEPCDRDTIVDLAKTLYAADETRRGFERSAQFFAKCGEHERLRWMSLGAHKRLGEWEAALSDANKLVEADGSNKDYRSWRGSLYEQLGQLENAEQDYRIGLALGPGSITIPTNLAAVYQKLNRPCDAVAPLEQLVYHHDDQAVARMQLNALYSNPTCASLVGTGHGVVRFAPGAGAVIGTAKINGKLSGRFVVDTGATFVALGPKFAKKLGLSYETWPSVEMHTAAGKRKARSGILDEVEIEGVRASRIEVVVCEEEVGPIDGLLGLSFLGRFLVNLDTAKGRLEISPRVSPTVAAAAP